MEVFMKRIKAIKSFFIAVSLLILLFAVGYAPAQSTPEYPKTLRYATHSAGTSYYAAASGFAKVVSNNTPMTIVVVPTSGSLVELRMMTTQKNADIMMWSFTSVWQASNGKVAPEPLPKGLPSKAIYPKSPEIRMLMAGPTLSVGMLARKESGIKKISDLKGKRIAWEWSGFKPNIGITLANLLNGGLTIDDVETLPITEVVAGVRALKEGRIDATTVAVGASAVAEADALVGVRFLANSMDPEDIKEGQRATPGGYPLMVTAGKPGVAEDTPVWSLTQCMITTTRLADHVAYKLVETWYNHYKEYQPIHPLLKSWTPDKYINPNFTAAYHNGAIQFYKEKGLWTSEMESMQKQLLASN
jgi:TRAP transporter TAXI family solute receptor